MFVKKILDQKFFNKSSVKIAKALLGKFLVRKINGKEISLMIKEVELYDGFNDRASHANRGRTKRNTPMFGSAGRWYVYLCYGMYEMLNVVIGKKNYPAAILIRGAGRYNGPGKLTEALKIGRKLNNKKASKKTGLWVEDRGVKVYTKNIKKAPRVGVHYAGPKWSNKKLRFFLNPSIYS